MKILMIDKEGSGFDFALRALADGHEVRASYAKRATEHHIGRGFVHIVDNPAASANWADLIFVTDNMWQMGLVDRLIRQGYPVFGPTSKMSEWEIDRQLGQKILSDAGVKTLGGITFNSYNAAIAYVKAHPGRYVSKPNGSDNKALSYVSHDAADMVYMLQRWQKTGALKGDFILQEFTSGVEMAVGAFYARGRRVSPWLENFEFKKFMNDDLGVATGEQGTVLQYVPESLLAQKVLEPVEHELAGEAYTGYIDVNCIVSKNGTPWPLEFTVRPGWPLFQIQAALHEFDVPEWMLGAIEHGERMTPKPGVAVGVVMSMPDYPYSKETAKETAGVPVYGISGQNRWNIHPAEMMLGVAPCMDAGRVVDKPMLVTAGDYVLIASGVGKTVSEAATSAYNVLNQLSMPNSRMFRTDIGKRLKTQLPILHQHGYAKEFRYG